MAQKVVIDFDDYSVLNNSFDLLLEFKERYPQAKVSLFTIPMDVKSEQSMNARLHRDKALKLLHENLDWLEIIPHGVTHFAREFEKADKTSTHLALNAIKEQFNKDEIPYVKGFKAPYWLWNKDVVHILDVKDWFGAVDPDQPQMLKTKKYYQHNLSIDTKFWESKEEVWKLHGHIDGVSSNDIRKCFHNLLMIPTDAEFYFVSDFIEYDKSSNVG